MIEISERYIVENWRTKEVDLRDIPEEVYSLTVRELLTNTLLKLNSVDLNLIELLFFCIFDYNDWRVVRTPVAKNQPFSKYHVAAIQQSTGIRAELFGSGVPDYFLWDSNGNCRFVEVKASEDDLNPNQKEWAQATECEFYIAQLAPVGDELDDDEMIEAYRITSLEEED